MDKQQAKSLLSVVNATVEFATLVVALGMGILIGAWIIAQVREPETDG